MYQDFPFTIRDVAYLLNLRIRHKNAVSLDVDCPFCGESKGKLNLNLKKNVFKCNRCGEGGGMLALYAKLHGVDNQTACKEIKEALGKDGQTPSYQVREKTIFSKEAEVENAMPASDKVKHRTYSMFFSMLVLADTHRQNLLKRGFTDSQIIENSYKSTPVFGFKKLTKKLLAAGCTVKGVPGFYQDKDGEWTIHFSNKSSGFLIPVRNMDGLIIGAQIRLDHPHDGRKYIWLSSANYHMGTSSGSPIHLAGTPGERTIFVTEGPLKGDLAHALSGRTFGCVPGANQYANLPLFLQAMKQMGTEMVYEAYDMDKLLKTICRGDYNEKCIHCENYRKFREGQEIFCVKKSVKHQNIQRGCRKLAEICGELDLSAKALTWDTDEEGNWAEHVKGVDDYLCDLEQKNSRKQKG